MVIRKINNKDMFSFKIVADDSHYNRYVIISNRFGWKVLKGNNQKIEDIYYDMGENKRIYIKFENDRVLKQFRIIGLEIF